MNSPIVIFALCFLLSQIGLRPAFARDMEPATRPVISTDRTNIDLQICKGLAATNEILTIWNSGQGIMDFTVSNDVPWLELTGDVVATSSNQNRQVTLTFNITNLPVGTYQAAITITDTNAANSPLVVPVTLDVFGPVISVSEMNIALTIVEGDSPSPATLEIRNAGCGELAFALLHTAPWLTLAPDQGTSTGEVEQITIQFNSSTLAAGDYADTITVTNTTGDARSVTVNVSLTVLGRVATPTFDPPGDTIFSSNVTVTILCGTPGAEIHYTTDNTDPGLSAPAYLGSPIVLTNTTLLRARAWKDGMLVSKTALAKYTMVRFVPADYRDAPELVNMETPWRFNQSDNLDGVNWTAPEYDDSAWAEGLPLFSYPGGFLTTSTLLDLGRNTYHFRTHFNFAVPDAFATTLISSNYIDDGAVFYLNGTEIGRQNMPWGPISYDSVAVKPINGPPDWETISLSAAPLRRGDNTLAVEVHQWGPASTDIFFATHLNAVIAYPQLLQISQSGTGLIITWQLDGLQIQESTSVHGPWHIVAPRPLSPFRVQNDGAAKFFRALIQTQ